jgi:hypothetical protein
MIITQTSIVLPDGSPPLTYPVIGWDNAANETTVTADVEADGYPATNLGNYSTNLTWRGGSDSPITDTYIYVSLSDYAEDVDYVAIAGHNFGTIGATVTVEYEDPAGSPIGWIPVGVATPTDNSPLMFQFTGFDAARVRVKISGESDIPEAAVLFVGKLLRMPRGVQEFTPLPYGWQRDIVTGQSEAGDFIGRIQVGGHKESNAEFIGLFPSFVRDEMADFLEASALRPFFFAWNPLDYPEETGFAWLRSEPVPLFDLDGYASVTLEMTGII